MGLLGKLVPEGRLKHWARLQKAKVISRLPEGRSKVGVRLRLFRRKPHVDVEYLVNAGENAVIVGCRITDNIEKLSHCVGKSGRVIVIEPDRNNLSKHQAFVKANRLSNVTIIPKAAMDKKGTATFLVAPVPMDHRIQIDDIEHDNDYRADNYYIDSVPMEVDTIDNILADLGITTLGYAQIMINGAEMCALLGMEHMLKSTSRLFVKAHARNKDSKKPLSEEIIPFLEARGFNVYKTVPSKSVAMNDWKMRTGDVFAWRPK